MYFSFKSNFINYTGFQNITMMKNLPFLYSLGTNIRKNLRNWDET